VGGCVLVSEALECCLIVVVDVYEAHATSVSVRRAYRLSSALREEISTKKIRYLADRKRQSRCRVIE